MKGLKMDNSSKLYDAIGYGELEEVKKLITPENINKFDTNSITPLMVACHFGSIDVVKFLIEKGADINLCSRDDGYSAFLDALRDGHEKIAEYLLENGADIFVEGTIDGNTPIQYAIDNGFTNIANELLDRKCKITNMNDENIGVLDVACENGYYDIAVKLIKMGAYINNISIDKKTPLTRAAKENQLEIVKLLLNSGADININLNQDYFSTALSQATINGHEEVAEYLYENGAKLSNKNLIKAALIGLAINSSIINFTKKLINDVDDDVINYYEDDMDKVTLVSSAAGMGLLEIVGELVKRGADINAQDILIKSNPLYKAIFNNHPSVVYFLLELGADLTVTDSENKTPLDVAIEEGHNDVIDIFQNYMKKNNINPADICNTTIFH
jgi:ankyrin repeat protein